MRVKIINIGKVKDPLVIRSETEYLKRFSKDWRIQREELSSSLPASMSELEVKNRESKLIQAAVPIGVFKVLLEEKGKEYSSPNFAKWLTAHESREICFVIGGAYGLADELHSWGDATLSLSKLTFPHQLTRLILVEQLYRAYTILKNIPYHK